MIHKMRISIIIYDNGRPTVKVTAFPGRARVGHCVVILCSIILSHRR